MMKEEKKNSEIVVSRKEKKKVKEDVNNNIYLKQKESQEISGLCMRLLVLKFSTKKSHKIHYTK